jgi:glutathione synthase/RimK-type ligase-like ATP-grasp enzyme
MMCSGMMTDRFREAAREISVGFGLTLFGFDVIIPTENTAQDSHVKETGFVTCGEDDELVVIDVNFFPSYKEVSDFPTKLRAFLRSSRRR